MKGPFDKLEIKPGLSGGIAGTAGDLVGGTVGTAGDLVGGTVGAAGDLVGGAFGMEKKAEKPAGAGGAPRAEAVEAPEERPKKRGFFSRFKKPKK